LWGGVVRVFHGIRDLASLVYFALPLFPALVAAMSWREHRRLPFNPVVAFIAGGVLSFLLYQICPGTAPRMVFQDRFPGDAPAAATLTLARIAVPDTPRNAMPSMHATWVLIAWWCARPLSWRVRIVSAACLVLTLLATLGLGEHYLCDLIVACTFALAICAGCSVRLPLHVPERWQALSFGAFATVAWLLLLRTGTLSSISRPGAWMLTAFTLAGSVWLERRMGKVSIQSSMNG
jgi:hypothetical protein